MQIIRLIIFEVTGALDFRSWASVSYRLRRIDIKGMYALAICVSIFDSLISLAIFLYKLQDNLVDLIGYFFC